MVLYYHILIYLFSIAQNQKIINLNPIYIMGLFDKLFSQKETKFSAKNEHEAWIAILYGCMSADGNVSDAEIDKFTSLLGFKHFFRGVDMVSLYKRCALFQKDLGIVGSQALIEGSADKISEDDKLTVFALAADLLLADGKLEDKEKEILEFICLKLNISQAMAEKIIEVALIRTKGNLILVD